MQFSGSHGGTSWLISKNGKTTIFVGIKTSGGRGRNATLTSYFVA
jgi:hypothetical protein